MRKPTNRKDRLKFIAQKKGVEFAQSLYLMTDSELKQFFDSIYETLCSKPDYNPLNEQPTCIRCGSKVEIEFHTYCLCGEDRAVYSEDEWKRDIMSHTDSERCEEDAEFIKCGFRVPK